MLCATICEAEHGMISYHTWINGAAILGVVGMVALSNKPAETAANGIDPIVTASTANRFMVVDHDRNRTCIVALHRAEGYDVHRIEPGNCKDMPAHLADARAWQHSPQDTIRITDSHGNFLMKLGPSDGFAWEVVQPSSLSMSFEAY